MAKSISLISWTDLGIREVWDASKRTDKAMALAKSSGGELEHVFMTMGSFDLVAIIEMPDDETMAKFTLASAMGGHIRTTTLKALDEATYRELTATA